MDIKFKWLLRYFAESWRWVWRNPIIIILILILVGFNYFSSSGELSEFSELEISGSSIYHLLIISAHSLVEPRVLIAALIATTLASAITIFEMSALFAIFQEKDRPLLRGIKGVFSLSTPVFTIFYGLIFAVYGIVGISLSFIFVDILGLTGIVGGIILTVIVALTYPIVYMLLSVAAMLTVAQLKPDEFVIGIKATFDKENFYRLTAFYVLRIGSELLILLPAAAITNSLGFPVLISALLIILALSIPFALMRTTGFILKLDVFKDVPWFQEAFRAFYLGLIDDKLRSASR